MGGALERPALTLLLRRDGSVLARSQAEDLNNEVRKDIERNYSSRESKIPTRNARTRGRRLRWHDGRRYGGMMGGGGRLRRHDGRRTKISCLPARTSKLRRCDHSPLDRISHGPPHCGGGLFFGVQGSVISAISTPRYALRHRCGKRFRRRRVLRCSQVEARSIARFWVFLAIRLDRKWPRGYTPRHLNFSPFSARLLDPASRYRQRYGWAKQPFRGAGVVGA